MKGKRLLSEEQEVFVRNCYNNRIATMRQLAEMFSCSPTTISYTVHPEKRERLYEQQKRYKKRKAQLATVSNVARTVRDLTLADVEKKVEAGARRVHGEIQNATIDDLKTLSDTFNVRFTVYFE